MERNETKHTPGPWECGKGGQHEPVTNVYCNDSLGSIVATCAHQYNALVSRETEVANARLVAAAPTLLAVLQDAGKALAADTSESSLAQRIRAAIALATSANLKEPQQ